MEAKVSDEMLRLEVLRLAAQTASPNMHEGSLLIRAEELFHYIKTGEYSKAAVAVNH